MPFRVVNCSPHPSHKTAAQFPDEESVYSDASSDNGTLHTVYSDLSNKKGVLGYPQYFGDNKHRLSDEYDPYAAENSAHGLHHASPSCTRSILGTIHQLASALGPDNVLQTTEIDSIPCAGVRIPHGPLKGLLAWRLVVRISDPGKSQVWWKQQDEHVNQEARRRVHSMRLLSRPLAVRAHSTSHSVSRTKLADTDSLPSFSRRSFPDLQDAFAPPQPQRKPIALVSNFILDTSSPHSVISRDALSALAYPLPESPTPEGSTVTLSIQGVPTRLSIANHGEASRLGVQFLHDAGVSVFFPQNADGIGPVLYRMCLICTLVFYKTQLLSLFS